MRPNRTLRLHMMRRSRDPPLVWPPAPRARPPLGAEALLVISHLVRTPAPFHPHHTYQCRSRMTVSYGGWQFRVVTSMKGVHCLFTAPRTQFQLAVRHGPHFSIFWENG